MIEAIITTIVAIAVWESRAVGRVAQTVARVIINRTSWRDAVLAASRAENDAMADRQRARRYETALRVIADNEHTSAHALRRLARKTLDRVASDAEGARCRG